MRKVVISQMNSILQPAFENIILQYQLKGGEVVDNTKSILQSPLKLPPIFNQQMYIIYALIEKGVTVDCITLEAQGHGGTITKRFLCQEATIEEGVTVHKLAARSHIRELEENQNSLGVEDCHQRILHLAKLYNLASSQTSFVCVNEVGRKPVIKTMELRPIPLSSPMFAILYIFNHYKKHILSCFYSLKLDPELYHRCS